MINKDKKRKLRKILAKISPEDRNEIAVMDLKDEVKEIINKLPKDSSKEILELKQGLILLNENILSKLDNLPTKESLAEIKKNYLDSVQKLYEQIDAIDILYSGKLDTLGKEVGDNKSNVQSIIDDIKEFKKAVDKSRIEILSMLGRGGSMNRKITVAGSDVLNRYTDINFVGATSTSNDDQNKRVNINLHTGDVQTISGSLVDNTDPQNPIINSPDLSGYVPYTYETTAKNLKSYPYTFNRTGDVLNSIVYTTPTGIITKTFNYSGDNVSSIVLSGDTPSGIDLTKTFNYTGSVLTSITYS